MTKTKLGSLGLSLLVIVLLVIWMATGEVKVASNESPPEPEQDTRELTRVEVETLQATAYQPTVRLQGQLEPWQTVMVSARAAGTVERLQVELGQHVAPGQTLLKLSTDGRDAVVERWRSRVRKLEADLAGARQLHKDSLVSDTDLMGLESDLAEARAELTAAELEQAYLQPVAPFAGIVNQRQVDEGTLVQVGTPLFELVQVDRLKATGRIPQRAVRDVVPGQAVDVELLDGTRLEGTVSFVASAADSDTRSFAVEVEVENPDLMRAAGGTASLHIQLPEKRAMFLSPAHLSLGEDGRPGVKYVDDTNLVVFRTVELLSMTATGTWVGGLPDSIRLITRGGGFVTDGETVDPVDSAERQG